MSGKRHVGIARRLVNLLCALSLLTSSLALIVPDSAHAAPIAEEDVGDAAEQCRHPLLLRFFCEAYSGQDVGELEDIRLKELFDRYWD